MFALHEDMERLKDDAEYEWREVHNYILGKYILILERSFT